MSPKHPKDSSLLQLHVYVRPHLIGRAMFDGDFLPINFVLNKNLALICLVRLELLAFPLVLSRTAPMLI